MYENIWLKADDRQKVRLVHFVIDTYGCVWRGEVIDRANLFYSVVIIL